MSIAHEDLRNGATAASCHNLCSRLGALVDMDCLVCNAFAFEQSTGPCAIRAPVCQIHNNLRLGHDARASGLRKRQILSAPCTDSAAKVECLGETLGSQLPDGRGSQRAAVVVNH